MLVKEKFFNKKLSKKKIIFKIILIFFTSINIAFADLQKEIINKLEETKTLSFDFNQKISEKEESGKCFIKYPLLMKCNYNNIKKKVIISNGRTVAIIKKKYKKIYYYPLKTTPLYTILQKKKILNLIKKNKPQFLESNFISFEAINKNGKKLKILFDEKTLEFRGWKTTDAYSNNVSFLINNLKINNIIENSFFKIPKEEDL
jgi:outer membrane lipoprotein-sorting protein